MTKPLIKIPDIAYSIEGDLITLEQSAGCEFTLVELHRIHLQLLAEQMGLVKPVHQAHMSEVVNSEMSELFEAMENHWQSVCNDRHMDLEHMVDAKNVYLKLYSICRLIGLDPESLSNLSVNESQVSLAGKTAQKPKKEASQKMSASEKELSGDAQPQLNYIEG